jgi:hypothetical protein
VDSEVSVSQFGKRAGRVETLDGSYSRHDSLMAELRRLNGLRVALPLSLGLVVVLGIVLFGDTARWDGLTTATQVWAVAFVSMYGVLVAANESRSRRRLTLLREERLEVEARLELESP